MALKVFDSGEATRYPTYATGDTGGWTKIANQPSKWQIWTTRADTGAGVQTTVKYSGTTAYRILTAPNTACIAALRRTLGPTALPECYLSVMVQFSTLTTCDILQLMSSAAATSVKITRNAASQLLVYAGATLKKTIDTDWGGNEWHKIQLHLKTSTNTLEIILDDGSIIDCSGTAMADAYYLLLGALTYAGAVTNMYYDCIQVNDPSGSVNNSWPTSPLIPTALRPSSDDPASTDWTRSSGSNDFDMIKETNPDLDSTYVYSTVAGNDSLYGFTDLAEPANAEIIGVCLTIVAKRSDAAQVIPLVYRGGTTVELTAVDIGPDYMDPIEVIIELDPIAVGPWTQTNLNATEFGFKHVQV